MEHWSITSLVTQALYIQIRRVLLVNLACSYRWTAQVEKKSDGELRAWNKKQQLSNMFPYRSG